MRFCQQCGSAADDSDRFCVSCGQDLEVGDVPSVGPITRLGPYALVGVIGRGATGVVYLASDDRSGAPVALKVLDPALASVPGYADRLRSEAQILSQLADPHLVATYGTGEDEGHLFLVMEYVEGASLRVVEEQAGRLTPEQALGLIAGALEGLRTAHDHGLVHGDVKPDNIVVDRSGSSRLVDFGQVMTVGTTTVGGTLAYMSPEVARGLPVDPRSDIYSMGIVLYEALSGHLPFQAANELALRRMQAEDPPPPLRDLPDPVAQMVDRSLAKDPSGRPPSAAAFRAELEEAAVAAYGSEWRRRAAVAVLVGGVASLAEGLASPSAAAAPTATAGSASSASGSTMAQAASVGAKGGLIAAHPVLAGLMATVAAVGLVGGGVAVASGGGKTAAPTKATVHATSPATPALAHSQLVSAACAAANLSTAYSNQPNQPSGLHCSANSVTASTVDPNWVFARGIGLYDGNNQPQSDEDLLILNLKTHAQVGPTNVEFCGFGDDTAYDAVPSAVLASWGLHPCAGASTSTTTSTTKPVSGSAPAALVGIWTAHVGRVTITANGALSAQSRTYSTCGPGVAQPCDTMNGNTIIDGYRMTATLKSTGPDSATGTVTSSTMASQIGSTIYVVVDPTYDTLNYALGQPATAGDYGYCGPTAVHDTCGA